MDMQHKTFAQAWSAGEADLADLHRYVMTWQETQSDLPIYTYLGVSVEQYAAWLEKQVVWGLMGNKR